MTTAPAAARRVRLRAAALAGVILLGACARIGDPSLLPLPQGAIDEKHLASAAGRIYQTDFTLEAAYPDDSAARHYAKHLARPWLRCEVQPRWQRLQERGATVHQQAHAWVDREARRTIQVVLRYVTEGDRAERPAYPIQHVIVLEHIDVDVDAEVRRLSLLCPPQR